MASNPDPSPGPKPTSDARPSNLPVEPLGAVGLFAVLLGVFLPVLTGSIKGEETSKKPGDDELLVVTAYQLDWLGPPLLVLVALGGVFLGTRFARGVLAVGVALLTLVLLALFRIDVPKLGALTMSRVKAPDLAFGWLGWGVLLLGALFVLVSGALLLKRESGLQGQPPTPAPPAPTA
jgi:hypothetical protein